MLNESVNGALAAACSTILLYPVEVFRVRRQATIAPCNQSKRDISLKDILSAYINPSLLLRLSHTSLDSFLYYYLYNVLSEHAASKILGDRHWIKHFLVSQVASMFVVLVTQPLERIIYREQVQDNHQRSNACDIKSFFNSLIEIDGLSPSLLLCINPAIYYTVYDLLKQLLLRYKQDPAVSTSVSPIEAFFLGSLSKITATILTYPLIRAKVIMMTSQNNVDEDSDCEGDAYDANSASEGYDIVKMFKVMRFVVIMNGMSSLWKGIGLHLAHTTLRDAVAMAIKEKLSRATASRKNW
mmetsp:Transcript_14930/g.22463  ORF Transcript_14930/g.22463 Transcript_14930/m.22463 type:complete len:298 (+) Transcript_14930:49-942(+)